MSILGERRCSIRGRESGLESNVEEYYRFYLVYNCFEKGSMLVKIIFIVIYGRKLLMFSVIVTKSIMRIESFIL